MSTSILAVCQGESVKVGQMEFSEQGNYTDTVKNQYECDSIVRLNLRVIPLPISKFDYNSIGLEVSFKNTSEYANSYFWEFGDGTTDTVLNPVKKYSSDESYKVTLSVYSACGESVFSQTLEKLDTLTSGKNIVLKYFLIHQVDYLILSLTVIVKIITQSKLLIHKGRCFMKNLLKENFKLLI